MSRVSPQAHRIFQANVFSHSQSLAYQATNPDAPRCPFCVDVSAPYHRKQKHLVQAAISQRLLPAPAPHEKSANQEYKEKLLASGRERSPALSYRDSSLPPLLLVIFHFSHLHLRPQSS